MQPCLIHLHVISLVAAGPNGIHIATPGWASATLLANRSGMGPSETKTRQPSSLQVQPGVYRPMVPCRSAARRSSVWPSSSLPPEADRRKAAEQNLVRRLETTARLQEGSE